MRHLSCLLMAAFFVAAGCKDPKTASPTSGVENTEESSDAKEKGIPVPAAPETKFVNQKEKSPLEEKGISAPRPTAKAVSDKLADRSVDQLIDGLDSDEPIRTQSLQEIFRRGKDAVMAARPVLKDIAQASPPRLRVLLEATALIDDPEHPSKILPTMRKAMENIPGFKNDNPFKGDGKLPTGFGTSIIGPDMDDTEFLGEPVAKGLAKALDSRDEKESDAAAEILAFLGVKAAKHAMPEIGRWLLRQPMPTRSPLFIAFNFDTDSCLPAIMMLLKSDDLQTRRQMVVILNQRGLVRNPKRGAEYAPLLKDGDDEYKLAVAQIMFILGEVRESLPFLLNQKWPEAIDGSGAKAAKGDERRIPVYPERIRYAFERLQSPELEIAQGILREAILGKDENRKKNALHGLELMKEKGETDWNDLIASGDEKLQAHAVRYLRLLGKTPMAPQPLPKAPDENATVQEHVQYIRAIGQIQPPTRACLDALKRYVEDKKYALYSYSELPVVGPLAVEAAPLFVKAFHNISERFTQENIMQRLCMIPSDDPEVHALFAQYLMAFGMQNLPANVFVKRIAARPEVAPKLVELLKQVPQRFDELLTVLIEMNPPPVAVREELEKRLDQSNTFTQDKLRVLLIRIDPKLREKYLPALLARLTAEAPKQPKFDPKIDPKIASKFPMPSGGDFNLQQYRLAMLLRKLDPKVKEIIPVLKELAKNWPDASVGTALAILEIEPKDARTAMEILERSYLLKTGGPGIPADVRFTTEDVIEAIAPFIKDADPEVRIRVVGVLAQHAKNLSVPFQYEDQNPGSKALRLKLLDLALNGLRPALTDQDAKVRARAIALVSPIDPKLAPINPKDVAIKESNLDLRIREFKTRFENFPKMNYQDQNELIRQIPYLGPDLSRALLPELQKMLEGTEQRNWTHGPPVIQALDSIGVDALPVLTAIIEKGNPYNRRIAIEQITKLGTKATSALPALKKLLDDDYLSTRVRASIALVELSEPIPPKAVTVLKETFDLAADPRKLGEQTILKELTGGKFNDEDSVLRRHARLTKIFIAPALVRSNHEHRKIYLDLLLQGLKDSDNNLRAEAAKALRRLGPLAKDVSPQVVERLRTEPVGPSRLVMAQVLRGIDAEAAKKAGVR